MRLVIPSSQPLVTTGSASRPHHPARANPMTTKEEKEREEKQKKKDTHFSSGKFMDILFSYTILLFSPVLPLFSHCNDFVILVKSQRAGDRVMNSITQFIERKLKLKINSRKRKVVKATESEFLSFTFTGKKVRWAQKCLDRFKYRILKLTSRR